MITPLPKLRPGQVTAVRVGKKFYVVGKTLNGYVWLKKQGDSEWESSGTLPAPPASSRAFSTPSGAQARAEEEQIRFKLKEQ
jgi:hypothetical protein